MKWKWELSSGRRELSSAKRTQVSTSPECWMSAGKAEGNLTNMCPGPVDVHAVHKMDPFIRKVNPLSSHQRQRGHMGCAGWWQVSCESQDMTKVT